MQQKKQQNLGFLIFIEFFTKIGEFCKLFVENLHCKSTLVENSTNTDRVLQFANLNFVKK